MGLEVYDGGYKLQGRLNLHYGKHGWGVISERGGLISFTYFPWKRALLNAAFVINISEFHPLFRESFKFKKTMGQCSSWFIEKLGNYSHVWWKVSDIRNRIIQISLSTFDNKTRNTNDGVMNR